jgi:uncharacterized RDD family membrane protein YckC
MAVGGYAIVCPQCGGMVPSHLDACQTCGHVLASAPGLASASTPTVSQLGATRAENAATAYPPTPWEPRGGWLESRARPRHFAGFWIRVLAYLIDGLILLVPASLLRYQLGNGGALLALVVDWIYFAGLESSSSRATLGKMIVGVAVSDQNGNQISFGRATGRYFAKIISAITFGIGYLMVAWTDRKRGLHDMIAGTVVVRT